MITGKVTNFIYLLSSCKFEVLIIKHKKMNLHTNSYEYQINFYINLMKSKIENVIFQYDLLRESEFEENDTSQGFQVKCAEDVLYVLRQAKIDNGITLSEIKKMRRDKGYVIGDELYVVLSAR